MLVDQTVSDSPAPPLPLPLVKPSYILGLNEARGVAIVLVLSLHLLTPLALPTASATKLWNATLDVGRIGVDLFFVLSGFLITGLLLDSKHDANRYLNFYGRRALRVLPLYFVLLGLAAVASQTPLATLFDVQHLSGHNLLLYATFLGNAPSFLGSETSRSMGVCWSLAIEEQFYVLWPFAIFLLSRRTATATCLSIMALSPVVRYLVFHFGMSLDQIYYFTPCRLDGLAAGATLAIAYRSDRTWEMVSKWSIAIAATSAATTFCLIAHYHQPWVARPAAYIFYDTTAVLFGSIIVLSMRFGAFVHRATLLNTLGKYSFAIYLTHQAVHSCIKRLWTGRGLLDATDRQHTRSDLAIAMLTVIATGLLSVASWRWFEAPILSLKRHLQSNRSGPQPAGPGI